MTKINGRNRKRIARELAEQFPAAGGFEAVLALIAEAADTDAAEQAVEDFLDAADSRSSKVPQRYKNKYAALGHPQRCGDDFSAEFELAVTGTDANGKPCCDLNILREIAENNGLGAKLDEYQQREKPLNPGMQRMNIGNSLRAMIRKGNAIWWPYKTSFSTGWEDEKIAA